MSDQLDDVDSWAAYRKLVLASLQEQKNENDKLRDYIKTLEDEINEHEKSDLDKARTINDYCNKEVEKLEGRMFKIDGPEGSIAKIKKRVDDIEVISSILKWAAYIAGGSLILGGLAFAGQIIVHVLTTTPK